MYLSNKSQNYSLLKGPKTNKIFFKTLILKNKKKIQKVTNPKNLKINEKATLIPVTAKVKVKTPVKNVQAVQDIIYELMTIYFVLSEK